MSSRSPKPTSPAFSSWSRRDQTEQIGGSCSILRSVWIRGSARDVRDRSQARTVGDFPCLRRRWRLGRRTRGAWEGKKRPVRPRQGRDGAKECRKSARCESEPSPRRARFGSDSAISAHESHAKSFREASARNGILNCGTARAAWMYGTAYVRCPSIFG